MIVKYSICDVIFIDFFIENTIKSILFLLFFCFLHAYTIHFIKSQPFIKILDIEKYKELTRRDAEWLAQIIKGVKYEVLAIDYKLTLGAVKNRLKVIFDVLEVGDKRGFLNKYSNYKIYYEDEITMQ